MEEIVALVQEEGVVILRQEQSASMAPKLTRIAGHAVAVMGRIASSLFLVAMITYTTLDNTYVGYPRTAQDGLATPYAVKGIVVYISSAQDRLVHWARWVTIGAGAAAIIILLLAGDPIRDTGVPMGTPLLEADHEKTRLGIKAPTTDPRGIG